MTTYREIRGQLIRKVSEDPTNPVEGQIWYNTTTGILKGLPALQAWSSTAPTINTHGNGAVGIGTHPAGIIVGGSPYVVNGEEFNGAGYATGGDTNTGRVYGGGAGTQTAGLYFGGGKSPGSANAGETEEYNGTSWSEQNDMSTARQQLTGCGTQTAGLAAAGYDNTAVMDDTEEYDGTSWTTTGNTPENVLQGNMVGTQTSAYFFGGATNTPGSAVTSSTANYNGSTWTASPISVNTARRLAGAAGTATECIFFGGFIPPGTGATELYDGTAWTTTPATLANQNRAGGSFGSSTAAVFAGGTAHPPGSSTTASEEYNKSITVITAAAWASGPAINNARTTKNNGLGPTSASLIFGGNPGTAPYTSNSTEEYDGSSWTAGGAYPSANSEISGAAGTQTAALGFGQSDSPTSIVANYDGTSWTVNPATFPTGSSGVGTGEQSAAIYSGNSSTNSLEWDNTSWTAGGTMNTARTGHGTGFGNTTSAMSATGRTSPTTVTADSEEYDGTSWTSVGNVITARKRLNASKPLSNASGYIFGGTPATSNSGPTFTNTELWNGTNWSTAPNLGTATGNQFGAGTTDAFSIGGQPNPPITTATEIFTGETTSTNVKTITTS